MTIRTARVETDLPGIISVLNACEPDHPTTVEVLRPYSRTALSVASTVVWLPWTETTP